MLGLKAKAVTPELMIGKKCGGTVNEPKLTGVLDKTAPDVGEIVFRTSVETMLPPTDCSVATI